MVYYQKELSVVNVNNALIAEAASLIPAIDKNVYLAKKTAIL